MRLSEAIRKGGNGARQIKGSYIDGNGGYCAIGAALKAVGFNITWTSIPVAYASRNYFPILESVIATCPKCSRAWHYAMENLIPHLNDDHSMTFEQIAAWIETNFEKPAEISERENGHPPMIANKEVMEFIGDPVEEPILR